jgi:hypothetical protein
VFGKQDNTAINLSAIAAGTGGFVVNGESANDYSGLGSAPKAPTIKSSKPSPLTSPGYDHHQRQ